MPDQPIPNIYIGGQPMIEANPDWITNYCRDHLGLEFQGTQPKDMPYGHLARIVAGYLEQEGTRPKDEDQDDPIRGHRKDVCNCARCKGWRNDRVESKNEPLKFHGAPVIPDKDNPRHFYTLADGTPVMIGHSTMAHDLNEIRILVETYLAAHGAEESMTMAETVLAYVKGYYG